jgi:hypothetical protein
MKHIRPLAAAVTLTIAAFVAGFAHAEPKKEAPNYYFLGANPQQASLMSTSVEHNGDVAEAWVLSFLPVPQTDEDGSLFQSLWFLTDFNCKTNAVTVQKIDVMTPGGKKLASIPGDGKGIAIEKGSSAYVGLQIACTRDYPATVMTAKQASEGLKKYETAVQDAMAQAAKNASEQNDSNNPLPKN